MTGFFIDDDFKVKGAECRHYCSPTCHPLQTDENNWHFGCTNSVWPQNKTGDFVPFVKGKG